ncbi:MAG: TIGR02646 family protein [Calothrix sp. C42_A2020_038]|nr:TIGR02646 family protein [Calothrix sp. C42_A2020_038]
MKYIQKNQQPQSLIDWNQRRGGQIRDWKSFTKSVKNDVYQSLLKEQGFICAYCSRPITRNDCHIEHFRPKSVYKELTFEYTNLIASCQGEDEKKPRTPVHCGHKKGAWFDEELMISPLDPNCETYFKYSGSGEIIAADGDKQAAAKTTITKLALDIDKLRRLRRTAIDTVIQITEGLDDAEIQQLIHGYQKPDNTGRLTPFCDVIVYILQQY